MNSDQYIAVFGDVHGHLRLMFQLCRLWQRHNNRHLDGILQCGDLGFFPNTSILDKATKRFAQDDPEELGFSKYFCLPQPLLNDELLEKMFYGPRDSFDAINTPALWCHGNHEDFKELARIAGSKKVTAVDAFGMLQYIPSGTITTIAGARVAAIGGKPELPDENDMNPKDIAKWKYVDSHSCSLLSGIPIDILLSHGSPIGLGGESLTAGSALLRSVDENCWPSYHFYGHHRNPIEPARIGQTQCFWLDDVGFEGHSQKPATLLNAGCFGILQWKNREEHSFSIVKDSWVSQVTAGSWSSL
jgi:hypothetical protein